MESEPKLLWMDGLLRCPGTNYRNKEREILRICTSTKELVPFILSTLEHFSIYSSLASPLASDVIYRAKLIYDLGIVSAIT